MIKLKKSVPPASSSQLLTSLSRISTSTIFEVFCCNHVLKVFINRREVVRPKLSRRPASITSITGFDGNHTLGNT